MKYKDFEFDMKSNLLDLTESYWVVDYRFSDIANKASRNITPTEVKAFDVEQNPPSKRVYYADYYFKPVGASGKTLAKIIAPYDNTGYRGYTGIGLNVFKTEKEAKEFYTKQCELILEQIKVAQDESNKRFNSMNNEVVKTMLENGEKI